MPSQYFRDKFTNWQKTFSERNATDFCVECWLGAAKQAEGAAFWGCKRALEAWKVTGKKDGAKAG